MRHFRKKHEARWSETGGSLMLHLGGFMLLISVAYGQNGTPGFFCSCSERELCYGEESNDLVFAFNFQQEDKASRSIEDALGLGLVVEKAGDEGDDADPGYTDVIEWIDGGGVSLSPISGYVQDVSYQARLRTTQAVDAGKLVQRLADTVSESVWTLEAWVERTRDIDDVSGGPRRYFDLTRELSSSSAPSDDDSFSWGFGLGDDARVMELRWPATVSGLTRLNAELLPSESESDIAGEVEYEHHVLIVNVTTGYDVDPSEDFTDLPTDAFYVYYNGQRRNASVIEAENGNSRLSVPVPDWITNEPYRFAIGGASWDGGGTTQTQRLHHRQFPGDIFWMAMYNRVLSEEEVLLHYNVGRQVCGPQDGLDDSPEDELPWWLIPAVVIGGVAVISGVLFWKGHSISKKAQRVLEEPSDVSGRSGARGGANNGALVKRTTKTTTAPVKTRPLSSSTTVSAVSTATSASDVSEVLTRIPGDYHKPENVS